jgi:hypothetical protein
VVAFVAREVAKWAALKWQSRNFAFWGLISSFYSSICLGLGICISFSRLLTFTS